MKLSIIIPIYILDDHLVKLTHKCLESIYEHTKNYELIIIDNKSTKSISEEFKKLLKRKMKLKYIANKENVGIGKAWNQGAKIAKGKYICFMNNDIVVHKNWAEDLIEILKNKETAVAFPLSKNKEDDDYFERLAGFCWVIRRSLFNKLGRIDESYGIANFEDTDFYMRAKSKGYKLICSTKSKVEHYSRATCDKVKEVDKLYSKNEKKYFNRWKILPMLD